MSVLYSNFLVKLTYPKNDQVKIDDPSFSLRDGSSLLDPTILDNSFILPFYIYIYTVYPVITDANIESCHHSRDICLCC